MSRNELEKSLEKAIVRKSAEEAARQQAAEAAKLTPAQRLERLLEFQGARSKVLAERAQRVVTQRETDYKAKRQALIDDFQRRLTALESEFQRDQTQLHNELNVLQGALGLEHEGQRRRLEQAEATQNFADALPFLAAPKQTVSAGSAEMKELISRDAGFQALDREAHDMEQSRKELIRQFKLVQVAQFQRLMQKGFKPKFSPTAVFQRQTRLAQQAKLVSRS